MCAPLAPEPEHDASRAGGGRDGHTTFYSASASASAL